MSVLYPGILPMTFGAGALPGVFPNTFTSGCKFPNVIVPSGNDERSAAVFAQAAQDLTDRTNALGQEGMCWNSGGNYTANVAEMQIGNQILWHGQHDFFAAGRSHDTWTFLAPVEFQDTARFDESVTIAMAGTGIALNISGSNTNTALQLSGGNTQKAIDATGGNGAIGAKFTPGTGENKAVQTVGDLDLTGSGNLLRTGADKPTGASAYRKLRVATLGTTIGTVTVSGSDQDVLKVTSTGVLTITLSTPAEPCQFTMKILTSSSGNVAINDASGSVNIANYAASAGTNLATFDLVSDGTVWGVKLPKGTFGPLQVVA